MEPLPPEIEPLSVRTADGRTLEGLVDAPRGGDVLLFHHGSPGSGIPDPGMLEELRSRGLRYVAFARPGYAGSSRRPGRTIADVAEDAETILEQLDVDRCRTMGVSGGGPHALACAAMMPDRVQAAAALAAVAPFDAAGLIWLAGMAQENVDEFGAAIDGPAALEAFLAPAAVEFGAVTGADVADALGGLVPEVDRAVLTDAFAETVAADFRRGLSSGYWGWFDDDLAFVHPWGFDPGAIAVPVAVWQGQQDRMVPFAHGVWLADHVRGARSHLLAEHGHLSLQVAAFPEVLDRLIEA